MRIVVEIDDRVRAMGSVLLLTDLINMNDSWKRPEVKTLTLEHLARYYDHPCAVAAREIGPSKSMGSSFQCYAVGLEYVGGRFMETAPPKDFPLFGATPERHSFSDLLTDFCEATGLNSFWQRTSHLWDETVADCRRMLSEEDPSDFLSLLYGEVDVRLVAIPAPSNPTSFSYGPREGSTAYAIVGPPNVKKDSPEPVRYRLLGRRFQALLFHEFSHSLLNLVEDSARESSERIYALCGSMPSNAKFRDIYGHDPDRIWFDELFIRAATALYDRALGRESGALAYLERQEDEYGLGWIRPLYNALEHYLRMRKAGEYAGLSEFFPEIERALRLSVSLD
jgi:hypothetical protein